MQHKLIDTINESPDEIHTGTFFLARAVTKETQDKTPTHGGSKGNRTRGGTGHPFHLTQPHQDP